MIRFCGLPMRLCYDLARALIPIFPRLRPHSAESPNPIWLGANPPVCDLLDIVVLKLREIATVGYQHQLESDMGVPRGSLWKYLKMGKYGLSCVFRSLDASRIGLHEHVEEARACMSALERQFGPCPLAGNVFAYFLDGTVQRIRRPPLGPERDSWWSGNKKCYACNTVLLVSPFGLIHWYNAGLPGCINDMRASIEIFDALQDPEYNPFKAGTIVDYGLAAVCAHSSQHAVVTRPFCPGKDKPPQGRSPEMKAWRILLAQYSAWITSARQSNEWVNGDNKKGFPRWQMLREARFAKRMRSDLVLYLHLFNYRVRSCDWSQTRTVFKDAINAYFRAEGLVHDLETGELIARNGDRAEPAADSDSDVEDV